MYTKEKIGKELKEKINEKIDYADLSKWALSVYVTDVAINDPELDAILTSLMMMEEGPAYELSYKKLHQIADLLIVADSPIYTRQQCGKELQEKVKNKVDVTDIGRWAYRMYSDHMLDIDNNFKRFLKDLDAMQNGPEFALSYEELDQIADRLIAGEKNIDPYEKYRK